MSRETWIVLDHAKHPQGFVEMTRAEVRERTKNLSRVPSGDGGELYKDLAGLVVVEAYPPRKPPGVGACMSCGSLVDSEEIFDGRGHCKTCAGMPTRLRYAP